MVRIPQLKAVLEAERPNYQPLCRSTMRSHLNDLLITDVLFSWSGCGSYSRCQAGHLAQKTLIADPVMTFMGPNGTRLFTEMARMIQNMSCLVFVAVGSLFSSYRQPLSMILVLSFQCSSGFRMSSPFS